MEEEGREGGREGGRATKTEERREGGMAMVARAEIVSMRELNERAKDFSKTYDLFVNAPVYASVDLAVVLP